MIFRFSKLQDCIGNKLFHSGLSLLGEPTEEMTMLDKLHKLEKLSLLPNANEWLQLRELRNELTHEYPDEDLLKSRSIKPIERKIRPPQGNV